MKYLMLAAAVSLMSTAAVAQNITWKPVTSGNTQWGNAPKSSIGYRQIGPTTYGTDGSTEYRSGNSTVTNSGATGVHIGQAYFETAPDGTKKTCQKIGENTFCSWK